MKQITAQHLINIGKIYLEKWSKPIATVLFLTNA